MYRVRLANSDGEVAVLRSADAGRTWQRFTIAGAPPTHEYGGQATGIVAPDGRLIVVRFVGPNSAPETWILGPSDTQPQPVTLNGLPPQLSGTFASALTGNADAGYLLAEPSGDTVYRSLDGLTWWAVQVRATG